MAAGEPGPDEGGGPPARAEPRAWGRAAPRTDGPAGRAPAIRPFLLTAGRVAGGGAGPPLPVETQVVATSSGLCRPRPALLRTARHRRRLPTAAVGRGNRRAAAAAPQRGPGAGRGPARRRTSVGPRAERRHQPRTSPYCEGLSMVSVPSPTPGTHSATPVEQPPVPVKMVIAGGFGVGKTTAVGAISEIRPLTTEAAITEVAAGVDDLTPHPATRPPPRSPWTSAASPSTRR